jgi:hypothetical protein
MSSAGAVVAQPALGRVADLFGYSRAYVVSGLLQLTAVPFLALARRENARSDVVEEESQVASHESRALKG